MTRILEKKQIAPNIHQCVVEAPEVAKKAKAGQFVIVIPDEYSERTPMTISDCDAEKGSVTFVFLEIGASTQKLAELKTGEDIYSFTGPLGRPFELKNFGEVALVAGCYGIGGVYLAAKELKKLGNTVTIYPEARSKMHLYWNEKLEKVADKVKYATADGSLGLKGHSHDYLTKDLALGIKFDKVIAVGCTFMMFKISEATRPFKIDTTVSMNTVMIDGTGMCGACRLVVDGKTKFACVDGPHFDGHKIDWNIILSRRSAYLEAEIISQERL